VLCRGSVMRFIRSVLSAAFLFSGCVMSPEIDTAISAGGRNAAYPALLISAEVAAIADAAGGTTTATIAPTAPPDTDERRAKALRARAARLRAPVLDPATKQRLRAAETRQAD